MKKYGVFTIAILISFSLSLAAQAAPKKSTGIGKSMSVINKGLKAGAVNNVKSQGGIYGKGRTVAPTDTPAVKTETAAAPVIAAPAVVNDVTAAGSPVNVATVRRNQSKEDLLATGILYLNSFEYSKALDSFKKAQSISNDHIVQRWVEVANNKIKIKSINTMLEDVRPTN